jgi:tetratricopeptide (TPR) repeat protein
MSFVYLAHDPELDRDVALKLMRVRVGPEGARRLHREAQALAKLSHPNVVPVYDAGMVGGQAFVAMEYVPGKTLRQWLKGTRTWREIVDVMMDAGRGLAAAHARGLIHRDFKPDNVLIGDDGRVRVLDFGLARLAGMLEGSVYPSNPSSRDSVPPSSRSTPGPVSVPPTSTPSSGVPAAPSSGPSLGPSSGRSLSGPEAYVTRADQLIGTPAYMAPEQVRRDHVDERTDVYAYGVTFYEALYGVRPFAAAKLEPAGSAARTVTTITSDAGPRVPAAPKKKIGAPGYMQRIVLRALEHDPRDRWASMDEMLAALARDPYRKWRRAGAAAAGLLTIGAVAAGFAHERSKERMCHGGTTRAEMTWGGRVKDGVRAAFARTGLPYANDAADAVARELDSYTTRLAERTDDACAATRLRGEQSQEALDLRTACYERRWHEVEALVDVLSRADDETVTKATQAAHTLSPVDDCADVASLRATIPEPKSPEAAAKVDALDHRLAAAVAAYRIGQSKHAATLADGLLDEARQVGFPPIVARIDFWRARSYADLGEGDKSIPAFREAFRVALASREDRVLKDSAARLAQEYIYASKPDEFDYWADVAQAAIDRGAPDPDLQSFLDHTRCVALWGRGKILSRLACLEKHAAKVEPVRPLDEWELTTLGLAAVDVGQFDRGVEYARRGYEYSLRVNGPLHPRTLEMRMYVCRAQIDDGDYDAAEKTCSATLDALQRVAGDNQALVGRGRIYLIDVLIGDKKYDEARAQLALATKNGADAAAVEDSTARIDAATGHADRALPHFREALAEEQDLPAEHPDVIGAKLALGRALLDSGAMADARTLLDEDLAAADRAELSPIQHAEVEFADARVLWEAGAATRPRALELARKALEAYAASAPKTRGFKDDRAEIDGWLAKRQ